MNVLLLAIGSHGDVHPFVGVGRALRARGHAVRLMANALYCDLVERAGLGFVPLGSEADFNRIRDNPDVWHPRKGGPAVLGGMAATIDKVADAIAEHRGDATLVTSTLGAIAARPMYDASPFPLVVAHLSPICVRSYHELPRMPAAPDLNWMPMWLKRQFWAGADRYFLDPILLKHVNPLREKLGLAPACRVFETGLHSPALTLCLWPDWFAPPQPDWPANCVTSTFPLYDEADVTPMSDRLQRFLDDGEPPIAFTPGSAMVFGHRFFQTTVDACKRLGRRGVLLTRHGEQIPKNLPDLVIHEPFAPFGQLLPRCAAVVHHGGVGSMSQALRAGVPMLITAMSHDQYDNGVRVTKLNAGRWMPVARFKPRRAMRVLGELIESDNIRAGCARVKALFATHDLSEICERIERVR